VTSDKIKSISYLIGHYLMMKKVHQAGGLRKELTPEICVFMHIKFVDPNFNSLEAMMLANRAKYLGEEILKIPF
tara:strand:+ start:22 stop:243 length:222 start_codon:yes stop_codon:yes gene_type:complete